VSGRGPSLAELQARLRAAAGPADWRRIEKALRDDPRAGARRLAEQCARRLAEHRRERRRVSRLFALRRSLQRTGLRFVAGVDEVGMGPLAGPVVAAAVILPDRVDLPGLDDSKRLDRQQRETLAAAVREQALALHVGEVAVEEIDRLNIYRAGLEAMRRAVLGLAPAPDHVLVDARTIPGVAPPQTALVGGDGRDGSVAAASIVAKVHRDALMRELDARHPGYGFARHKGYATRAHLHALRRLGPCPIHRRSFSPVVQGELFGRGDPVLGQPPGRHPDP
jgi:ribonuclease HII